VPGGRHRVSGEIRLVETRFAHERRVRCVPAAPSGAVTDPSGPPRVPPTVTSGVTGTARVAVPSRPRLDVHGGVRVATTGPTGGTSRPNTERVTASVGGDGCERSRNSDSQTIGSPRAGLFAPTTSRP
jgi:hypothetical protein